MVNIELIRNILKSHSERAGYWEERWDAETQKKNGNLIFETYLNLINEIEEALEGQ